MHRVRGKGEGGREEGVRAKDRGRIEVGESRERIGRRRTRKTQIKTGRSEELVAD